MNKAAIRCVGLFSPWACVFLYNGLLQMKQSHGLFFDQRLHSNVLFFVLFFVVYRMFLCFLLNGNQKEEMFESDRDASHSKDLQLLFVLSMFNFFFGVCFAVIHLKCFFCRFYINYARL